MLVMPLEALLVVLNGLPIALVFGSFQPMIEKRP